MLHRRMLLVTAALSLGLGAGGLSHAALEIGQSAPPFTAQAALDGKQIEYSLADNLRKGPVVLYFFPSAFSAGCSVEAHEFAVAMDTFAAAGTSVVGVSRDDMGMQKRFSVTSCMGKFPVATDTDLSIAKSYDAVMQTRPDFANRISYVIAPDGKIIYRYSSLNPYKHIENTLNALKAWQATELPGSATSR